MGQHSYALLNAAVTSSVTRLAERHHVAIAIRPGGTVISIRGKLLMVTSHGSCRHCTVGAVAPTEEVLWASHRYLLNDELSL